MKRPGFAPDAKLPGFDTLAEALQNSSFEQIDEDAIQPFLAPNNYRTYLENQDFLRYMKMHKVPLGVSGAKKLQGIGSALEHEYMPNYANAAAWAFAEAGLVDTSLSTVERIGLITRAEELWLRAAKTNCKLQESEYGLFFDDPTEPYRYALPLAFAPLMKSIVVGNVTQSIRQQALVDTVAFASAAGNEVKRYAEAEDMQSSLSFVGLMHELNALSTLLYIDDPRYIPIPSTARAGAGYFYPQQTHDLMVVHQHWGEIRGIVPVEVKGWAVKRARKRYKSLIIMGKMHLNPDGVAESTEHTALFERYLRQECTPGEIQNIDAIATEVREMLKLYQQGITPDALSMRSLMRFRESRSLHRAHPEIAPS